MNALELLEDEACKDGIDVVHRKFKSNRIKGLYCNNVIAIDSKLNTTEKACVMAEELGHHHTTTGNILDLSVAQNRKQERLARIWAYNKQIGLRGLINAFEHGCRNRYEIAEYLEVSEDFLEESVKCYREKYGVCTTVDNYIIYFEPLGVLQMNL